MTIFLLFKEIGFRFFPAGSAQGADRSFSPLHLIFYLIGYLTLWADPREDSTFSFA
jgi:hypothetical protein